MWLVAVQEPLDDAVTFLSGTSVSAPCLLDLAGEHFDAYSIGAGDAPYPLEVLIDRDGVISYISREYDGPALTEAIRAALDAPMQ